jgi:hypothetical protein
MRVATLRRAKIEPIEQAMISFARAQAIRHTDTDPHTGRHPLQARTQPLEISLAKIGTALAVRRRMLNQAFVQLLTDIHHSLDRVCEDLERDRPDLAQAMRSHSAWIPRPDDVASLPPPPSTSSVRELRPLLYEALDAGFVDARQFDVLMLERARAEHVLEERQP